MKYVQWLLSFTLTSLFLTGCAGQQDTQNKSHSPNTTNNTEMFEEAKGMFIEHIHGIGYVGNENELYVATHEGLVKYSKDKWYTSVKNKHDYMGFQAISEGFYSSGHPEPGSELENPLGLIKSSDGLHSLKKLTLHGEVDFHYLAAGYNSNIIYVLNEQPNSQLNSSGLFYTENEGKNWTQSKMDGFRDNSISAIATHPVNPSIIGLSSNKGLFLSENYGQRFKLSTKPHQIIALEFQETSLLYYSLEESALYIHNLKTQKDSKISTPAVINEQNPVLYLATNPKNRAEITLVTYENDIFQTKDKGTSWQVLIRNGNQ